jgi:hypothetical protein
MNTRDIADSGRQTCTGKNSATVKQQTTYTPSIDAGKKSTVRDNIVLSYST